jgi:hypothetical protein
MNAIGNGLSDYSNTSNHLFTKKLHDHDTIQIHIVVDAAAFPFRVQQQLANRDGICYSLAVLN